MASHRLSTPLRWFLILGFMFSGSALLFAQGTGNPDPPGRMRSTTRAQRKAARLRAAPQGKGVNPHFAGLDPGTAAQSPLTAGPSTLATMTPGAAPDYFGVGNYANSPLPTVGEEMAA